MRKINCTIALATLLVVCSTITCRAAPYSVQSLGVISNYDASMATDINNNGVVSCMAMSAYGIDGFLWSNGEIVASGPGICPTAGVNDAGQTASWRYLFDESGRVSKFMPFIRNADSSMTDLTSPDDMWIVSLRKVLDGNRIVALFQYRIDDMWVPECEQAVVGVDGSVAYIGGPDGAAGISAISDGGNIILDDKYLWTISGGATILPWLENAGPLDVTCISDSGWLAGILNGHAVRWDSAGNLTDLGLGSASGINNLGQVVGNINNQAVLWDIDGNANLLPTLDGYLRSSAIAINDNGQIAGTNWISRQETNRAVIWQTTPEPPSIMLMSIGLAWIMVFKRRN